MPWTVVDVRAMRSAAALWLACWLHAGLGAAASADPLSDWTDTARTIATQQCRTPICRVRTLALVHVAMFAAIDTAERGRAGRPVSLDAAVASAAHDVLATLHPDRATDLSPALAASLAAIANDVAKARGFAAGRNAATEVFRDSFRAAAGTHDSEHVLGGLIDLRRP